MSMPKFPEIDPEITCEHALNMILASIAMEELALSHIINAEGEKLQYVLGTLETNSGRKSTVDEVLAVNQSITCLMDSVAQNQMILKSKMDKALCALTTVCPGRIGPPGPPGPPGPIGPQGPAGECPCKCSAVFRAEECRPWCAGSALPWNKTILHGKCIRFDPCDKTKIYLHSNGRFMVSFAANVKAKSGCQCDAAIRLQMISNHQHTDIYTVRSCVPAGKTTTMTMDGMIVEAPGCHAPSSLSFKLVSHDSLIVEDSKLNITEI